MRLALRSGSAASLILLVAGCGGSEGSTPDAGDRRAVMVVDNAFDETLPVFRGKIAGSYTLVCAEESSDGGTASPDGGTLAPDGAIGPADGGADGGTPLPGFAEAKAALLAELARPDERCHLEPGVAPVPHRLEDLESRRESWNAAVLDDRLAINPNQSTLDQMFETIAMRLNGVAYHGTATAGVIAGEDANVSLVLVSRRLGMPTGGEEAKIPCIAQAEIDQAVALLRDPEVRAAHIGRAVSSGDRDLYQAMQRHGVQILNQSFGRRSRLMVELTLALSRCGSVSLGDYFAVTEELETAHAQVHMPPSVLVVQAAGNDGARVTGPRDHLECHPGHPRHLLVGSYGLLLARSDFSNFGPCVDLYAPGELIVAPLPGDWLFPLSGTSFAAPMVSRWLAQNAPAPFDPASARAALLAQRQPSGNIPVAQFPPRLLYDPRRHVRAPVYARKAAAAELLPPLEEVGMVRQKLWPIRTLRRLRGLSDL